MVDAALREPALDRAWHGRDLRHDQPPCKGQLLATAGSDGSVRLWQSATGHLLGAMPGHSQAIHCVSTSSTGRLIATGLVDGSIVLWDAANQHVATLKSHTGAVYAVALSDNGRWLASGGLDGTARLWDTTTGEELRSFEPNGGPIYGVAVTRDARLLAVSTAQKILDYWRSQCHR